VLKQEVLSITTEYLKRLEHERYVTISTDFLRSQNPERHSNNSVDIEAESLLMCFACGGSGKRWKDFLGTPKHFVDIGKNQSLINYSVFQFTSKIKCNEVLLIDEQQKSLYSRNTDVELISREGDPDEDVAIEILGNQSLLKKGSKDLLLLMGDVAWSWEAVQKVVSQIKIDPSLRVFGRSKKNEIQGNTGGEIFGAYVPYSTRKEISMFYAFCKRLYHGNASFRMTRLSTWEVLALVTAAGKLSAKSDLREIASPLNSYLVSDLHPIMRETLERGSFMETIWSEIDDETEDFDFPYEYLQWLRRQIERCP